MIFTCNICATSGNVLQPAHYENPELPSCSTCGSNIRFRWLLNTLSLELFGRSLLLSEFPVDPSILGLGLTDPPMIAEHLAKHFTYWNTFFDTEPRFDIRNDESPLGALDFLIASEVFEHVEPPVDLAFRNAARLLKPSGVFLLTTPWVWDGAGNEILPPFYDWKLAREENRWVFVNRQPDGKVNRFYDPSFDGSPGPALGGTREHFPHLHDWRLIEESGNWILRNRKNDGPDEVFHNLVFHGGPGLALEMRLFTRADLESRLRAAGFHSVKFDNSECRESELRSHIRGVTRSSLVAPEAIE